MIKLNDQYKKKKLKSPPESIREKQKGDAANSR